LTIFTHQRHVQTAVGVIHRGNDGERRQTRKKTCSDRLLAEQPAEDDSSEDAAKNLADEQRASFFRM